MNIMWKSGLDWKRATNEYERRAFIYWEYFCHTGNQSDYDNYIFWFTCATFGKSEALKMQ